MGYDCAEAMNWYRAMDAITRQHLQRCIELAAEALEAGDQPFGSVLVGADGSVLAEDRNRVNSVDATYHPEIELARWAARNLCAAERAETTMYTSGEHCPMCAGAHGCAGLGRIVYASSAEQLAAWRQELGIDRGGAQPLRIQDIVPHVPVDGPFPEMAAHVRTLYRRSQGVIDARSMR